jgi:hypothetical protein
MTSSTLPKRGTVTPKRHDTKAPARSLSAPEHLGVRGFGHALCI